MFGHTHIKMSFFEILNHFIINFFFIILKNLAICVSKHYAFVFVTIIEFLHIYMFSLLFLLYIIRHHIYNLGDYILTY